MKQSICVATAYATLGVDGLKACLQQTEAQGILVNYTNLDKVIKLLPECPALKHIVVNYFYCEADKLKKPLPKAPGVTILSFQDLMAMGVKSGAINAYSPSPNHLAVIMYTSGSTGTPKGVMIRHSEIVAIMGSVLATFKENGIRPEKSKVSCLSHLPLAHIFELACELSMIAFGGTVCYSDPRTLSSKGAVYRSPSGEEHPQGGIATFKPTLLPGVPKIWDSFRKAMLGQASELSSFKQYMFKVAYAGKAYALAHGRDSPLFNLLVFNKIYKLLGGNLELAISGGGPLSAETHEFLKIVCKLPLIQGYGSTEIVGAAFMQHWDRDMQTECVGAPMPSIEAKLIEAKDGDEPFFDRDHKQYSPDDIEHNGEPCHGRGEILVRGPSVTTGYFRDPETTQKSFDCDGWFHTGDVGVWLPNGTIRIVDRIKNLIKLKGGEYVAIENMESVYSASTFVNSVKGGVLCYGDGSMDRAVAFVQIDVDVVLDTARNLGIDAGDAREACKNPEVNKMVLDDLHAIANQSLCPNEKVAAIQLIHGTPCEPMDVLSAESPWTPENGGLTPAQKLNRRHILSQLSTELSELQKLATF